MLRPCFKMQDKAENASIILEKPNNEEESYLTLMPVDSMTS
jgi:hypothetical protein